MTLIKTGRPLIPRRAMLRAGGVAFALPLLEAMRPSRVRAANLAPKRFVVFFTPNGSLIENWIPQGGETDFVLSPILSPLAAYQRDLLLIHGLYQQGAGGDGHQNGISGMLTGQRVNPGPFQGGAGFGPSGWANGISIDQRAAQVLGASTRLRSLELGVQVGRADNLGRMSFLGPDRPVPPEESPARAYARLFSAANATPDEIARLRSRRRSVLDAVLGQFQAVAGRVGAADKVRLDAHATMVRDIEARLDARALTGAACPAPSPWVDPAAPIDNDSFPAIGALQMDLIAVAFACDMTRVASLMWSRSVSMTRFTWLPSPVREAHHELSHLSDGDTAAVDKLTRINNWYAQRFADLLGKLAGIQDVDGSRLLDSALVLWCNELARGNTHSRKNASYVLAGGAGGAIKTGRSVSFTGDRPHNDLLVSMLLALDVPTTTFGDPEWNTGALPL